MTDDPPRSTSRAPLADLVLAQNMTPQTTALAILGIAEPELAGLVATGQLDSVTIEGRTYLDRAQVRAVAYDLTEARAEERIRYVTPLTEVVTAYLQSRTATLRYREAGTSTPLVLARRGRPRVGIAERYAEGSLYGHDVAVHPRAISSYAATESEHPDASLLPTGPALIDALLTLPGVSEQNNVSPAAPDDRRSRRVYRWLRLDGDRWPAHITPEDSRQLRDLAET